MLIRKIAQRYSARQLSPKNLSLLRSYPDFNQAQLAILRGMNQRDESYRSKTRERVYFPVTHIDSAQP